MNDDERAGHGTGSDDEALAQLRAADPAAGAETSMAALRAKVDAQLGDELPPVDRADELAARRRRRTPWLAAASVAALAAVGAGGYALGAGAAPRGAVADSAPPIVLNGGAQGGQDASGGAAADRAMAAEGAPGASADEAAGGAGADGADSGSSLAGDATSPSWYSSGRALFHGSGLSTETGTARAYAFDATDAATREGASRVAKALGVDGEPRWEYGSWAVGPRDGEGPTVWLSVDGSASFGFNDPAADPWRCEEAAARDDGDDGCADQDTSTVGDRAARRALTDAMRSLGVDPDGFELEAGERTEDDPSRWVTASQVVDGTRTGAQWSATVGEAGIAWLDGFLAPTTDLGTYPVISAADAVERLGDPRFTGSAWPVVYADETGLAEAYEEPTEPTPPPAPPAPGDPVDWPVSEVDIVDARLGLAQQYQDDGSVVLVPAYELSDADGNAWSVIAVADDAMDFAAPR